MGIFYFFFQFPEISVELATDAKEALTMLRSYGATLPYGCSRKRSSSSSNSSGSGSSGI